MSTEPPAANIPIRRALLAGLIDYAGLFPPAALTMERAVADYAAHRASGDAWILGRFIVPAARLDAFEAEAGAHLPREAGAEPWRLSVLVGGDLAAARARIERFNRDHATSSGGQAVVETIESKAGTADEVVQLACTFAGLEAFCEIDPHGDPAPLLDAAVQAGAHGKIRLGGVTADAFPPPAVVARFLAAARRTGAAFKATAGLHHPLRGDYRLTYEPDSAAGTMHGFLNVFLAAGLLYGGALEEEKARTLLEVEAPSAFSWEQEAVRWQDTVLTADTLGTARRDFARSYGSCSLAEPVAELRALGLC